MLGLMQDWPLLVHRLIDHAAMNHGEREIVTRSVEGPIRRTTLRDVHSRARSVAKGLEDLGYKLGDIIATLAWNTDRHLEVWYGIMGIGAVCHTINPRLFPDQITYIMNHAEDKAIFVDTTFLPILEGIKDGLPHLKEVIVLTDKANMPESSLKMRYVMRSGYQNTMMITAGQASMKTRQPASAIPQGQQATRRVFYTLTAPMSFIHCVADHLMLWD